ALDADAGGAGSRVVAADPGARRAVSHEPGRGARRGRRRAACRRPRRGQRLERQRRRPDVGRRPRRRPRGQRRVREHDGPLRRGLERHGHRADGRAARHDPHRNGHLRGHMKYLFSALFGLLLGAAAAGAILYFNPLTAERAPVTDHYDGGWRYVLPEDALTFVRGQGTYLPDETAPLGDLWEKSIQRSALLGLRLRDAE